MTARRDRWYICTHCNDIYYRSKYRPSLYKPQLGNPNLIRRKCAAC